MHVQWCNLQVLLKLKCMKKAYWSGLVFWFLLSLGSCSNDDNGDNFHEDMENDSIQSAKAVRTVNPND